jgi:hypothetical protein
MALLVVRILIASDAFRSRVHGKSQPVRGGLSDYGINQPLHIADLAGWGLSECSIDLFGDSNGESSPRVVVG